MGLSDMLIPGQVQMGRPNPDETTSESTGVDTSPERIVAPWDLKDPSQFTTFAPAKAASLIAKSIGDTLFPQPERGAPTTHPFAGLHEDPIEVAASHQIGPESKPLIAAVENGYADKKFLKPIDLIREGIKLGDSEQVKKGHKALADLLLGDPSFGERYTDLYYNHGANIQRAHQMAGDVVMNEIKTLTGAGMPTVESATQLGLLDPSQLLPSQQPQPIYANMIPQEPFAMDKQGMPLASVQMQGIPAQSGQVPASMQQPSNEYLNPLQFDAATALLKAQGKTPPQVPEGIQLFDRHMQALTNAHIAKTGQPPGPEDIAQYTAVARGLTEKEPVKGGLQERKLTTDITKAAAETERTQEQTTTERLIRPDQINEVKAKTTNLLAYAHQAMANASDAVRKGEMAVHHAQLEQARTAMTEVRSQMQALALTMAEGDLSKADKVKMQQLFLDLTETGVKLSKRSGFLGLDFLDLGKPNVGIEQVGPPGTRTTPPPAVPAPAPSGVNPFTFAPAAPGGVPSAAQPPVAPPTPGSLPPEVQTEYLRLRALGVPKDKAKKQALEKAEKKAQ
jgi:hypothetical protein